MRIRNLVSVALAAGMVLLASSRADASLQIALQQDGGVISVVGTAADFTSVVFSGVYGDFNVVIQGGSSTNGATLSSLLESANSVTNTDTASHTLSLWVVQTNYTLPVGTPLAVEAGMAGTINTGTMSMTGVFQPWGDNTNTLTFGIGQTPGPINATQVGSTFDTGSLTGLFNRTTANSLYAISSRATLNLSGGGTVNFTSHVNVTQVPEPASMLLFGTGLFGVAVAARRRAKAAKQ